MPLVQPKPLPPAGHLPPVTPAGVPDAWQQWLASIDATVRNLASAQFNTLVNAANDAAAAAAGVSIGQLYRNGNAVQIRLV